MDVVDGFGPEHLPYGSVTWPDGRQVLATRLRGEVIDLAAAAAAGHLPVHANAPDLDRLLAAGPVAWSGVRVALRAMMERGVPDAWRAAVHDVAPALPFTVADYVDFYASEAHATRVGRLFRPDDPDPLPAAWKHLPIGYHGRAGTVRVTGTDVVRPHGLRPGPDGPTPGPTTRLDLELEVGLVLGGPPTTPGTAVRPDEAERHVFGVVLLDDWSARDLQAFEYRPLGPFLGKSFQTSVSAWVTPLAALEPHRAPVPPRDGPPFAPHLDVPGDRHLDLDLAWALSTPTMRSERLDPVVLGRSRATDLWWTPAQQVAHLASNGATIRPGDLCGTGTVSGWGDAASGCLLEATENGARPLRLPSGEERTWLEDGDEVVLTGATPDGTVRLGEVRGRVVGP